LRLRGSFAYIGLFEHTFARLGTGRNGCTPRVLRTQLSSECLPDQSFRESDGASCVGVCCRVLPGVAEYCRVLQGVAVCGRVLQGVAGCCRVLQGVSASLLYLLLRESVCMSSCVAVCCRVLQCVAARCRVLHGVVGCCRVL